MKELPENAGDDVTTGELPAGDEDIEAAHINELLAATAAVSEFKEASKEQKPDLSQIIFYPLHKAGIKHNFCTNKNDSSPDKKYHFLDSYHEAFMSNFCFNSS
jgi:hypothetical protein